MTGGLLAEALRAPESLLRLSARDWERVIYEAGACELMTRLAETIDAAGLAEQVPERAGYHLAAARMLGKQQHRDVARELTAITEALCPYDLPFLVLKGGAYIAGGLEAGRGRTLSDIDILVRKADLAEVEARLDAAGWIYVKREAYDQDYYRRWMHELPPMLHLERGSVLDVHHTVTPPTSAMAVEGTRIFEQARFGDVTGSPLVGLPMPADLVLHSAVHLFNDSEFEASLRDLSDLDLLLREFGREEGFWSRLTGRAQSLGLTSSLYFAVTLARHYFATPVPADVLSKVEAMAPPPISRALLTRLFMAVLEPPTQSGEAPGKARAAFALFVRGHGLRMPPHLLLPHLLHQALRRARGKTAQAAPA